MWSFLLRLSLSAMMFNGCENMNTQLPELKIDENIQKVLPFLLVQQKTVVTTPHPTPPPPRLSITHMS